MSNNRAENFRARAKVKGFQVHLFKCRCPLGFEHFYHVCLFGNGIRKNMPLPQAIEFVAEFKENAK